MTKSQKITENNDPAISPLKFWGTITFASLLALVCVYFAVIMVQTGTPVAYIGLVDFPLTLLAAITSIVLVFRRKQELGLKLAYYAMLTMGVAIILLFQGRTTTASLSILAISIIAVRWLFPIESRRRYFIVTAAAIILMWVIEAINPAWRIPVQAATIGPAAAVAFGLIIAFLILRRTWGGKIRTKLVIAFTIVTLIPLVTLGLYDNTQSRNELYQHTQDTLGSLADQTAHDVDAFISNQLAAISLAAQNQSAIQFLFTDPTQRTVSMLANTHSTLNALAHQDTNFIRSYALLNNAGTLVADSSNQPPGQDQSQAPFFKQALLAGGAVVTGPFFDETTKQANLYFSASIKDANGTTLGVIVADYDAGVIENLVEQLIPPGNPDQLLFRVVDNTNFVRIAHTANLSLLYLPYKNLTPDQVAALQQQGLLPPGSAQDILSAVENDTSAGLDNLNQNPFFITVSKTINQRTLNTGTTLKTVPWLAFVRQSEATVLAPLDVQTRDIVLISLALIGLAILAAFGFAQLLSNPILRLSVVAQKITEGDLNARATANTNDEIGSLASSFNKMTAQLRDLIGSLEQRVADRTKDLEAAQAITAKRAVELQSVAEIATKASQAASVQDMLQTVVDGTKSGYNLYHAHIYLLDDNRTKLLLTAGAGEVGRQMVSEKRSIPFDHPHSLVARAARTRQGAISNDVTQEPDFLPNPLLPDTKSEMAIPISVGDTVFGVLDVQADITNRFTNEDVAIKTTLAQQVGTSLQNIRSYELVEQGRAESDRLYLIGQKISAAKDRQEIVAAVAENIGLTEINRAVLLTYEYNAPGELDIITATGNWYSGKGTEPTPLGRRYPAKVFTIVNFFNTPEPAFVADTQTDARVDPASKAVFKAQNIYAFASLPLWNGPHQVGSLFLEAEETITFTGNELQPYTSVMQQVAIALDNKNLLEETLRKQAELQQGEARLRTLVENAPEAIVVIDLATGLFVQPNENAVKLYGLSREELLKVGPAQMSPLTQPDGRDSTEGALEKINEAMQGAKPVFEWTHRNAQGQDIPCEIRLVRLPGDQPLVRASVTDITERKHQQELTVQRAQQLETVAAISTASSTLLDPEKLLQTVTELTKERFNLYHSHIYLLDESGENLVLTSGAGEAGRQMVEEGRSIPLDSERSLVARAAREQTGVIVNDVTQAPDFLPNPLLPDTRSELAVPMIVGRKVIGVFDVQSNETGHFTEDNIRIQTTLASQVAVAIQNANLLTETTTARAASERLFEAGRRLTQTTDLQTLVEAAVESLNIPVVNRSILGVLNYDTAGKMEGMTVVANWWNGTGHAVTPIGTHYSMEALRSLSMFTSPTPVFFDDLQNDDRMDTPSRELVKRLDVRALVGLPLYLGSRQLGSLILEAEELHHFSQDDIHLFTALAPQIATLLENRRQFERAQQQAERETTLNTISQKIQSATSVEAVLQIAARELGHALGAPMTIAQLSLKDNKQ